MKSNVLFRKELTWWMCWKQSFLGNYLSAVDLVTNCGHKPQAILICPQSEDIFLLSAFPRESIPLVCILFST